MGVLILIIIIAILSQWLGFWGAVQAVFWGVIALVVWGLIYPIVAKVVHTLEKPARDREWLSDRSLTCRRCHTMVSPHFAQYGDAIYECPKCGKSWTKRWRTR